MSAPLKVLRELRELQSIVDDAIEVRRHPDVIADLRRHVDLVRDQLELDVAENSHWPNALALEVIHDRSLGARTTTVEEIEWGWQMPQWAPHLELAFQEGIAPLLGAPATPQTLERIRDEVFRALEAQGITNVELDVDMIDGRVSVGWRGILPPNLTRFELIATVSL